MSGSGSAYALGGMLVAGAAAAASLTTLSCAALPHGGPQEARRAELARIPKIRALKALAREAGVEESDLEDADDAGDTKGAVIDLILRHERVGAGQPELLLRAGGEPAASAVTEIMEHAVELLEQLSLSSPRKARRSLRQLVERMERALDSIDAAWCDGMSLCTTEDLRLLSDQLVAVQGVVAATALPELTAQATAALKQLTRCGSTLVQSAAVLRGASAAARGLDGASARLDALTALSGLPNVPQQSISDDEVLAASAVLACIGGDAQGQLRLVAEREEVYVAAYVLAIRNGSAVCELLWHTLFEEPSVLREGSRIVDSLVQSSSCLREACAMMTCSYLLQTYATSCVSASVGVAKSSKYLKGVFALFSGDNGGVKALANLEEQPLDELGLQIAQLLTDPSLPIACGAVSLGCFAIIFGASPEQFNHSIFSALERLYRRVVPFPRPLEWWISSATTMDAVAVQITAGFATPTSMIKRFASPRNASCWKFVLQNSIETIKMHSAARLAESDTWPACGSAVWSSLQVVELAATAQHEEDRDYLADDELRTGIEHALLSTFDLAGRTMKGAAASAAVALVGRNEGGKTLGADAINAVLQTASEFFEPSSLRFTYTASSILPYVQPVLRTMAVSDANKLHMLRYSGMVDLLINAFLLGDNNPRRGQPKAELVQELSASVMLELALFGPGAKALRAHAGAIDALRELVDCGMTKESRECAASALFEVDEEQRAKSRKATPVDRDVSDDSMRAAKPPPHVMASYNWDHQDVILRVVGSLQSRGYLVWVDTEQMKGATVDTMALAVEGSAAVLIGVSRAYKESLRGTRLMGGLVCCLARRCGMHSMATHYPVCQRLRLGWIHCVVRLAVGDVRTRSLLRHHRLRLMKTRRVRLGSMMLCLTYRRSLRS
jgi:hypothetical protein